MRVNYRWAAALVGVYAAFGQAGALAQSAFETQGDPAEIHGYKLDVEERHGRGTEEQALQALKKARSTGQDIQMLYSLDSIRFVTVAPDDRQRLQTEIDKQQRDLTRLRTAIESSTLFYSAMRSEGFDLGDVIGVEISAAKGGLPSEKRATVFLARR